MVLNIHRPAGDSGVGNARSRAHRGRLTPRHGVAAVVTAVATTALSLSTLPADAAVGGGRSIEVFTGSNLVALTNYPAGTSVRVEVLRQGFPIAQAVKNTDAGGTIEMNHVGTEANDCFDPPSSPDIMPGDTIRSTILASNTVDTSRVRGVWIDDVEYAGTSITLSGRLNLSGPARVVPGTDVLELRINKDTPWDGTGRVDKREEIAPADVNPNGTWTHVMNASAGDVAEAEAGSETFLEWSAAAGETEAFPSELTVAEFGPGEVLDCPPMQQGPTAPQLTAAMDSGRTGDHVTNRSANLTFAGLAGSDRADATPEPGPGAQVRLLVDGAQRATGTAGADGVYRFTGVTLAPRARPYTLTVEARDDADAAPFTSPARRVTVDAAAPAVVQRRLGPNPLHLAGTRQAHAVYRVGEAARVTMQIQGRLPSTRSVRTFRARNLSAAALVEYAWNGRNQRGQNVRPGRYRLLLTATDRAGNTAVLRSGLRVVR